MSTYPTYAIILMNLDGMAIAEDPEGNLCWANIPEEYAEPGQAVELEFMRSIDELPPELRSAIRATRAAISADLLAVLTGGDENENVL